MASGLSISIGLNFVDPAKYMGWRGQLNACENDARDISRISELCGFKNRLVLTSEADSSRVLSELDMAAKALYRGDILLLYFSGHGGQVGDVNGDEARQDKLDETWCLFDRMLVDDELYLMWSKFRSGVRIFVLSDSCHSGTVSKAPFYAHNANAFEFESGQPNLGKLEFKTAPFDKCWALYQRDKSLYDAVQFLSGSKNSAVVSASVLLISGCQDNQLSLDGNPNSLFTATLKEIWNSGSFNGSYRDFHKAIVAKMPPSQTPNFFTEGVSNSEFEAMQPFKI